MVRCQNDCFANETAATVTERLSNITGIDSMNSEYLQLLKYEAGQHYKVRTSSEYDIYAGVLSLTFTVYNVYQHSLYLCVLQKGSS